LRLHRRIGDEGRLEATPPEVSFHKASASGFAAIFRRIPGSVTGWTGRAEDLPGSPAKGNRVKLVG
jgi:hypothetical protein